ncbi:hypothetical protein ACFQ1R_12915 [Mariniflexile jejuense]|uniref:Uncharacterized protein n=1 Tax=Mariniflexile jejuense TaxID=1173582 RepID=A0ABW3JKN1_9FLAO
MIEYKFESYTIIGTSILVAGLLRLYLFYKCFNISILPFIDLDELTTLVLDNILYFSMLFFLNLIIISLFYKNNSNKKTRLKRLRECGFFKLNKILLLIIIIPILYLIQANREKVFFYEFIFWVILLFIGIYFNPLIYFESQKTAKNRGLKINKLTIIFILSAINLCFFAGVSGISEAHKIKSRNYYKGSKFSLDNETEIISDSKKYYIGKTKNYFFFYLPKEEITQIIPVSRIKNIELKK